MNPNSRLNKRHGMHEFGVVYGVTKEIRVNRLERRLQPRIAFPHRHDFYHMLIIRDGAGWHEIDFKRYRVLPNQVFFMKPGQVHSWDLRPGTRGYVVEFGIETCADFAPDGRSLDAIDDGIRLKAGAKSPVLSLGQSMLHEYEQRPESFELALKHELALVLIALRRLSGPPASARDARHGEGPVIERFLALVEQHFRLERRVSFYSSRLGTTPKALTMRVARSLGRSARAVIQDRCLLEAKRLLAYSDFTIGEVAYEVGFEDQNYFSRFFRAEVGSTPRAFRAKARPPRRPPP